MSSLSRHIDVLSSPHSGILMSQILLGRHLSSFSSSEGLLTAVRASESNCRASRPVYLVLRWPCQPLSVPTGSAFGRHPRRGMSLGHGSGSGVYRRYTRCTDCLGYRQFGPYRVVERGSACTLSLEMVDSRGVLGFRKSFAQACSSFGLFVSVILGSALASCHSPRHDHGRCRPIRSTRRLPQTR